MKRRFFECALLLGIVMSVMFLAQTQDGIGHVKLLPPHPNTGVVAPDPNHSDSDHPPCGVEDDWNAEEDPDPRNFSDCGLGASNSKGSKTSWALHYYGGKLSGNESMHPDGKWQCQMKFYLRVDVSVSAGNTSCSASVTPSISPLTAVPVDETPTYEGAAHVDLLISGVNFHDDAVHHWLGRPKLFFCGRCFWGTNLFTGAHCEWESREKKELNIHGPDNKGAWIGIDIRPSTESHTKSLTAGADYQVTDNLNLNLSYGTSKTSEISGHVGLIYGVDVSIGGWEFYNPRKGNAVIEKQSKSATASGYVEGASPEEITATYDGMDAHVCPPYDCPSGECPPRMP